MKKALFLLCLLMFWLTQLSVFNQVKAINIGNSYSQNKIEIISQTGIDVNIKWDFREINNTHWLVTFTIPSIFAVKDYPLITLSNELTISKNSIDMTKDNSFYIIFPKGFREGLNAKFGVDSTTIGTTSTTPFNSNQRAICRDSNNEIHITWLKNSTALMYANSTDNGLTFNSIELNNTGTKTTPSIGCNVNNITIAYDNILYTSTNNGFSWSYHQMPSGVSVKSVESSGSNIYMTYTASNEVYFINSSDFGLTFGTAKLLFDGYNLGYPDCEIVIYSTPTMTINRTNTDIIFVVAIKTYSIYEVDELRHRCILPASFTNGAYFINSTDGGNTFGSIRTISPDSSTITLDYPSITYNKTDNTRLYVSFRGLLASWTIQAIYFSNSTNSGLTWTTPYQVNKTVNTRNYPSISLTKINTPIVFWEQPFEKNVTYVNYSTSWSNEFLLNPPKYAGYINTKWDYSGNCNELVYKNITALCNSTYPCSIIYDNLNPCLPYSSITTTTSTTTSTSTTSTSTSTSTSTTSTSTSTSTTTTETTTSTTTTGTTIFTTSTTIKQIHIIIKEPVTPTDYITEYVFNPIMSWIDPNYIHYSTQNVECMDYMIADIYQNMQLIVSQNITGVNDTYVQLCSYDTPHEYKPNGAGQEVAVYHEVNHNCGIPEDPSGDPRRTYLKFNISALPNMNNSGFNVDIIKAYIRLYNNSFEPEPLTRAWTQVYHIFDGNWNNTNETTLKWNNQPCPHDLDNDWKTASSTLCNMTKMDNQTIPHTQNYLELDVTNAVKYEYDRYNNSVSLLVKLEWDRGSQAGGWGLHSSDTNKTYSPSLQIEYTSNTPKENLLAKAMMCDLIEKYECIKVLKNENQKVIYYIC